MASDELSESDNSNFSTYIEYFNKLISNINKVGDKQDFSGLNSTVKPDALGLILNERKTQREKLLDFIIGLTAISLCMLIFCVFIQAITRLWIHDYEIFEPSVFHFIITGVFGEMIGLIYVIVKSLWDDSKYLDKI